MSLLHEEALILIAGRQASSKSKTEALPPTVTLNALADLPLIAPSRPNAFRLLIESEMQRIQRKPRIVLEISSTMRGLRWMRCISDSISKRKAFGRLGAIKGRSANALRVTVGGRASVLLLLEACRPAIRIKASSCSRLISGNEPAA